jgi:hypothetical protein
MDPAALDQLIDAAAGKTAEQIEQEIAASAAADKVEDPAALAGMLARAAADPDYAATLGVDDGDDDGGVDAEPEPDAGDDNGPGGNPY